MRQGKDLENIVRFLEEQLNSDPDIKIESPKYLIDKTTGNQREHDVLITTNKGHHTTFISIECRDRTRPVGVSDIEAYANKCCDTGVNQGIIVSSSGFAETAKRKAQNYGIRCFSLEDVMNLNWVAHDAKLIEHRRRYTDIKYYLVPEQDMEFPFDEKTILSPSNIPVSMDTFIDMIHQNVKVAEDKIPWGNPNEELEFKLIFNTNNWKILHTKSEKFVLLKGIQVDIKYVCEHIEHELQRKSYTDQNTGKEIASLVCAPIKIGDEQMKAALMDTEKGRSFVLIKDR